MKPKLVKQVSYKPFLGCTVAITVSKDLRHAIQLVKSICPNSSISNPILDYKQFTRNHLSDAEPVIPSMALGIKPLHQHALKLCKASAWRPPGPLKLIADPNDPVMPFSTPVLPQKLAADDPVSSLTSDPSHKTTATLSQPVLQLRGVFKQLGKCEWTHHKNASLRGDIPVLQHHCILSSGSTSNKISSALIFKQVKDHHVPSCNFRVWNKEAADLPKPPWTFPAINPCRADYSTLCPLLVLECGVLYLNMAIETFIKFLMSPRMEAAITYCFYASHKRDQVIRRTHIYTMVFEGNILIQFIFNTIIQQVLRGMR